MTLCYEILKVKNALTMYVYYVAECTIQATTVLHVFILDEFPKCTVNPSV